jgi:hypothetical protein
MNKISKYFSDLAKSKDRMSGILYNSIMPGALVGLLSLSGKAAIATTALLLAHGIIRDVISVKADKLPKQKPTPKQ